MCGTTKAAAVPVIPDSEGNLCFIIYLSIVSSLRFSLRKELKRETSNCISLGTFVFEL